MGSARHTIVPPTRHIALHVSIPVSSALTTVSAVSAKPASLSIISPPPASKLVSVTSATLRTASTAPIKTTVPSAKMDTMCDYWPIPLPTAAVHVPPNAVFVQWQTSRSTQSRNANSASQGTLFKKATVTSVISRNAWHVTPITSANATNVSTGTPTTMLPISAHPATSLTALFVAIKVILSVVYSATTATILSSILKRHRRNFMSARHVKTLVLSVPINPIASSVLKDILLSYSRTTLSRARLARLIV